MQNWYLGTIGYSYKDWIGSFYPQGISPRRYLAYYSKVFNSVELDTTFHAPPRPSLVLSWGTVPPEDFKFCLKTPRQITHELRLKGAQGAMVEFIDSVRSLGAKSGPILIQLPPGFTQEYLNELKVFLEQLPDGNRYAVEFRHASWFNERTEELLHSTHVCWVSNDFPGLPRQIIKTTDFIYIRWIGINGQYQYHSYERVDKTQEIKDWLGMIKQFQDQVEAVYGFFNNDYAGFAAGTCKRFKILAGFSDEPGELPIQERLF